MEVSAEAVSGRNDRDSRMATIGQFEMDEKREEGTKRIRKMTARDKIPGCDG